MKESVNKILKMDLTKDYSFPVTYVDEESVTHSYDVFTNDQFRQIVKQMFGSRLYNDWDDESVLSGLLADFQASFEAWKAIRQDTYGRRMYALSVKFQPLENYRSHEERSGSFTHGQQEVLSFDGRKEKTTDDSYIERTHTNFKETTKDDSYIERTHTDLKETTTDDSYIERTHTDLKETTTDDSYVERSHTNFKETTTDDSFVEHSNNNYKETTKDDSFVEHSWGNSYEETYGHGQQTHTHNISADDSTTFVSNTQDIDSAYDDTKSIEGTTKDQNGYTTNGLTKEISGSTKDQHGQTQNGHVVETSGSYRDQHGQTTDGLIREQLGKETRKLSGTDLDGYSLERYGNIGVTTSQQMLASDLDLLKYDITMCAIKEFVQQYTYISYEVD